MSQQSEDIGFCPPECGPPPCQRLLYGGEHQDKLREEPRLGKSEAELCYEVYNCVGEDYRTNFAKFDHKYISHWAGNVLTELIVFRSTPSMRASDVMLMCSYNNVLNDMITPDGENGASQKFGKVGRKFHFYSRPREFWWKWTFTQNNEGTLQTRGWIQKRHRIIHFHKDTKNANRIRDGDLFYVRYIL